MKKMGQWTGFRAVCTLGAVVALAGCYEHTVTVGAGAPNGRIVYDEWKHHWIGGLIDPNQELELRDVCPSGNATIHNEMSFLNGLVNALTAGIYAPTTLTVRCATGRNAEFGLDAEDVAEIVSDPGFLEWVGASAPQLLERAMLAQQQLDG